MKKIILFLLIACFSCAEAFAAIEMPSTQGSKFFFSLMTARSRQEKTIALTISSPKAGKIVFTSATGAVSAPLSINAGLTEFSLAVINGSFDDRNTLASSGNANITGGLFKDCYTTLFNNPDIPTKKDPQNEGYMLEVSDGNGNPLKVSAYVGLSGSSTSDCANVYPIEALGNDYYIISRSANAVGQRFPNGSTETRTGNDYLSEFVIVAAENNTQIEIYPSCLIQGQSVVPGQLSSDDIYKMIPVTLNRGQTYLVQALSADITHKGEDDLTGTRIVSRKGTCEKFAVFSGSVHGSGVNDPYNNGDLEYDQLFPTNLWGTDYIVGSTTKGKTDDGCYQRAGRDEIRVVASKPCTDVYINNVFVATLNQGDFYSHRDYNDEGTYIHTTKPVEAGLFTTGENRLCSDGDADGGPALIVLAPLQQYLREITFAAYRAEYKAGSSNVTEHSLMVTSLTSIRENTHLINNTYSSDELLTAANGYNWEVIASNPDYSQLIIAGLDKNCSYTLLNDAPSNIDGGFTAIVYGSRGKNAGYGYSAGSSAIPLSTSFNIKNPATNQTIPFKNLSAATCITSRTVDFTVDFQDYVFDKIEWDFNSDGAVDTTLIYPETKCKFTYPQIYANKIYDATMTIYSTLSAGSCGGGTAGTETVSAGFTIQYVGGTHTAPVLCKKSELASTRTLADFGTDIPSGYAGTKPFYIWTSSTNPSTTTPLSITDKLSLTDDFGDTESYYVDVFIPGSCTAFRDTFDVTIKNIDKRHSRDTILCKGSAMKSLNFDAYADFSAVPADTDYKWYKEGTTGSIYAGKVLPASELGLDFGQEAKFWVEVEKGCMISDTVKVKVEPIRKTNTTTALTVCKTNTLDPVKITDYKLYSIFTSTSTPNDFTSGPTYAWYKDIPSGDISKIELETPVQKDTTISSYELPATDDFGSSAKYYRLSKGGCAVVEEFDVTIEPIQKKTVTPVSLTVCKGSELKAPVIDVPITSYIPYSSGTTPNEFANTPTSPTYSWYKDIPAGDVSKIKAQTPLIPPPPPSPSRPSYTWLLADDFGTTSKYYRLSEDGCAVVEEFVITVQPIQTGNLFPEDICKKSTITSTRTTYVDPVDGLTKTFAAPNYTWYKGVSDIQNIKSGTLLHTGSSYPDLPDDFGDNPQYYVLVENGCAVVDHFDVKIKPVVDNPEVVVDPACIGTILSSTTTNASPDFASYNGSDLLAYNWSTSETTQDIQVQGSYLPTVQEVIYTVEGTKGCKYVDHFKVKIPAEVKNDITFSKSKVCGDGTTPVTVTLSQTGSVTDWRYNLNGDPDVVLTPTDNTHVININPTAASGVAEDYTYTVTSESACQTVANGQASVTTKTVTANPPFTAVLDASGSELSGSSPMYKLPSSGGVVTLSVTTPPANALGFKYVWNDKSFTSSATNQANLDASASYTVTVTDQDGLCVSTSNKIDIILSDIILNTLIIPNSTNQYNRSFGLFDIEKSLVSDSYTNGYSITIFNRYGTKIFEESVSKGAVGEGWDGKYKGIVADAGVYFYVLEYKTSTGEIKVRKGTVEIKK